MLWHFDFVCNRFEVSKFILPEIIHTDSIILTILQGYEYVEATFTVPDSIYDSVTFLPPTGISWIP